MAQGNPLSFLHVSKPEIDLPESIDVYAPAVYEKGRENFQGMITEGLLRQDEKPCFYFYRQVDGEAFANRLGGRGELPGIPRRRDQENTS